MIALGHSGLAEILIHQVKESDTIRHFARSSRNPFVWWCLICYGAKSKVWNKRQNMGQHHFCCGCGKNTRKKHLLCCGFPVLPAQPLRFKNEEHAFCPSGHSLQHTFEHFAATAAASTSQECVRHVALNLESVTFIIAFLEPSTRAATACETRVDQCWGLDSPDDPQLCFESELSRGY